MEQAIRRQWERSGQSLIETCIAIIIISMLFMGIFQISQILAGREILRHAAARGARARTVGLNRWMVNKSVHVALIPNAGPMTLPEPGSGNSEVARRLKESYAGDFWDWSLSSSPSSEQLYTELARIPDYLGADTPAEARAILNYRDWDDISFSVSTSQIRDESGESLMEKIDSRVRQKLPLWVPMRGAFYAEDTLDLAAECEIESHYTLYIDDQNW